MTDSNLKTTRVCSGEYEVTDGTLVVAVSRVHYGPGDWGWVAAAQWDRLRYSDPQATKRQAVASARYMLSTPEV